MSSSSQSPNESPAGNPAFEVAPGTVAQLWDVVRLDCSGAFDREGWERRHGHNRGVVIDVLDDGMCRVIWTEDTGLVLHWRREMLIVVRDSSYTRWHLLEGY